MSFDIEAHRRYLAELEAMDAARQQDDPDGEDDDDLTDGGPAKRQKIEWDPRELESRRLEREDLGEPSDGMRCFGCITLGHRDSGQIQLKDFERIRATIRDFMVRTNPRDLARWAAKEHRKLSRAIEAKGGQPLAPWSAADALHCWRTHNTDPEMQHWMRQMELQELMQVALGAAVEEHPITKKRRINVQQAKVYMDLAKVSDQLAKSDPAKKAFYSAGAVVNLKTGAEGPIVFSGKTLDDYFVRRQRAAGGSDRPA